MKRKRKRKRKRDSSPDMARMSACADDGDSSSGVEYEVFLSFSSPDSDTHLSFIDGLYNSLIGEEIRVFRNDEEIRKSEKIGGELLRAIESSKIYMPIFSRNYASSAWCLRVLTHVLESSSKAYDKVIVPIFYEVNPDDAKLKTKLYLDSMEKHEEKFGRDDVRRWKEALTEVAKLEGWDLKDKGHDELIRTIVGNVSFDLRNRRRNLPDYLVGIDDHVEAIMNMLNEGSRDVRYLVIHGMGGIGKTTLASVVYNRISNQFQNCSFLPDVQIVAQDGRIVELQKQLLSVVLLHRSPRIHNSVDAGISTIRERFHDKKVLLVLDDVNKWDQVSKLAERSDWFGPGSKIIITTRDINFLPIKEVIKESSFQAHSQEFKFYEMTEMDSSAALQHFSKHAFEMDFPPHDFDDTSREIVAKKNWERALDKLKDRPSQDVLHTLEISFDCLEPKQKEIFLDIACFFIGKEKHHPYYMWKASIGSSRRNLRLLTRRSMIKILNDDTFWMHDQFRDLGMEIVRREDFKFPGKRSRLWEPKIAFDVVQMKEGTDKIVALRLTGLSIEHDFTSEEFLKMPNLRFLELEGGNLIGDFKNLLSKLTWLSWSNCPSKLRATNLCLEKLVVLKLSGINITKDWARWRTYLGTDKIVSLRLTGLSRVYNFTSEEFSKMRNLKFLELEGGNLVGDFENLLSKLTQLSWSNCPSELHATNLCLKKLAVLKLSGSNITEDCAGWETYLVSKYLKVIQITECPNLRRTPDVSKCSKLKQLVLQDGKTSLVANGSLSKLVVYGFRQD